LLPSAYAGVVFAAATEQFTFSNVFSKITVILLESSNFGVGLKIIALTRFKLAKVKVFFLSLFPF